MLNMNTILSLSQSIEWGLVVYSWMNLLAVLFTWIQADRHNSIVYWISRLTLPYWLWVEKHLPRQWISFAPYAALLLLYVGKITVPGIIRAIGAIGLNLISIEQGGVAIALYVALGLVMIASQLFSFLFIFSLVAFFMATIQVPLNNPIVRSLTVALDPFIRPLERCLPRASIDLPSLALAILSFFLSGFCEHLATLLHHQIPL